MRWMYKFILQDIFSFLLDLPFATDLDFSHDSSSILCLLVKCYKPNPTELLYMAVRFFHLLPWVMEIFRENPLKILMSCFKYILLVLTMLCDVGTVCP